MKKIFILLLISINAFAIQSARVDSSVTNIPASYDTTSGSLVLSESIASHRNMQVLNASATPLAVSIANRGSAVPSSSLLTNPKQVFVPASGGISMDSLHVPPGARIYIRSDSGSAISSGVVRITFW